MFADCCLLLCGSEWRCDDVVDSSAIWWRWRCVSDNSVTISRRWSSTARHFDFWHLVDQWHIIVHRQHDLQVATLIQCGPQLYISLHNFPSCDRPGLAIICKFWHQGTLTLSPERQSALVKNYKWWLNPVWHSMLYSCTRMATVDVKGLI